MDCMFVTTSMFCALKAQEMHIATLLKTNLQKLQIISHTCIMTFHNAEMKYSQIIFSLEIWWQPSSRKNMIKRQ